MTEIEHDFNECLDYSEDETDAPFWNDVYREYFHNMVSSMPGNGNTESQRMGIDRVALLGNGKVLCIQEKKRKSAWSDILLEYISVDVQYTPGWIEKDLKIDYLVYAFMSTGEVHLFPWELLRRAWLMNKADWIKNYPRVEAKNNGYKTISVAVPIRELYRAINKAMAIRIEQVPF